MKISINTNSIKPRTPIKFKNLRRGDLFQWRDACNDWSDSIFIMIDPYLEKAGQCLNLTRGDLTFFGGKDDVFFRIFEGMEVKEVREFLD